MSFLLFIGMKSRCCHLFYLTVLLVSFCAGCNNQIRTVYVLDHAGLLDETDEQQLNTKLKSIEESIGSQVFVLTITDLEGEKIEDYSIKQAELIKPGRKGFNDGVLITLSQYDRQVRIELGYGLECLISDNETSRIIQSQMIPEFVQEEYYRGINNAILKIDSVLMLNKDKIGRCKYNPDYDQEKDLITTE